jgi:hypothetical protein
MKQQTRFNFKDAKIQACAGLDQPNNAAGRLLFGIYKIR